MLADFLRFLEHEDRLVARAALLEQPLQVDRARQRRGTCADEEHVAPMRMAASLCAKRND